MSDADAVAKIGEYREDLEDLAESDLPCAEIAATLLDLEADTSAGVRTNE